MEFRLRENAGLRRFSYPVRARFQTERAASALRLVEAGKPVAAQFTQMGPGSVEVDFSASLLPWQQRVYRIEEGAGPAPRDTMEVVDTGSSFVVRHPSRLEFEVPNNLLGFLNAVRTPAVSYLRPGSFGLGLDYRDDIGFRAGGANHWGEKTIGKVVKQGPLACALRFDGKVGLRGSRTVSSVVEMEFPRSKSWVEATWTLDDVENLVSGMWVEIDLEVEGERTLVDYGADSMVYAALRPGQRSGLRGAFRRSDSQYDWEVDVGGEAYASGRAPRLEGWAHVMDSRRATATAMADFARYPATQDRIEAGAGGKLVLHRTTGGLRKELRFWLHFVSMPVQVGAATSPQSMQNPLLVDWT
jgi:hypothetical protein